MLACLVLIDADATIAPNPRPYVYTGSYAACQDMSDLEKIPGGSKSVCWPLGARAATIGLHLIFITTNMWHGRLDYYETSRSSSPYSFFSELF